MPPARKLPAIDVTIVRIMATLLVRVMASGVWKPCRRLFRCCKNQKRKAQWAVSESPQTPIVNSVVPPHVAAEQVADPRHVV